MLVLKVLMWGCTPWMTMEVVVAQLRLSPALEYNFIQPPPNKPPQTLRSVITSPSSIPWVVVLLIICSDITS